jgi:hypothetical protein
MTNDELRGAIYTTQALLKQAADALQENVDSLTESHTNPATGLVDDEARLSIESDQDLIDRLRAAVVPVCQKPAPVQEPEWKQIAEDLRFHGLTLVKTATGYAVLKLGAVHAQATPPEAQPAPVQDGGVGGCAMCGAAYEDQVIKAPVQPVAWPRPEDQPIDNGPDCEDGPDEEGFSGPRPWNSFAQPAPVQEPESFEQWNAKQHGDPEEIGFLQALRIAYWSGQDSVTKATQPAAQRQWKGLTDEDWKELHLNTNAHTYGQAIEAKLKEKNNG